MKTTFTVPNENAHKFEQFMQDMDLEQQCTNVQERDFYTDFTFEDLQVGEEDWIEAEINSYL